MSYHKKMGRHSVFGIYRDRIALDRTINVLKEQKFRNSDISVLMRSNEGTKEFAFEKHTKAPEGVATGVATGAVAGGIFGWLVGAGAMAIPGLGPFIAAGPIMATIAGAGVGGTIGGVAGGLVGLGIPEFEAQRYESFVEEGGILISIHVDDSKWEALARDILRENGATEIATTSEKKTPETTNRFHTKFEERHEDGRDTPHQ
ncbi:MAG: hypothetical protein Q7U04_14455 [Bacteriovorax sp.]|nr:hypothetical protein [Bacteriovorax sp.]